MLFPDNSFTWRTNVIFKERPNNPDRPATTGINRSNGTVEARGEGVEAPTTSPLNILEQPAPIPIAADNSIDDEETTDSDQGEQDSQEDNPIHTGPYEPVQRRSSRAGRGQTSRYNEDDWQVGLHYIMLASIMSEPYKPRTFREAQASSQWPKWQEAYEDEMRSLRLNKT